MTLNVKGVTPFPALPPSGREPIPPSQEGVVAKRRDTQCLTAYSFKFVCCKVCVPTAVPSA